MCVCEREAEVSVCLCLCSFKQSLTNSTNTLTNIKGLPWWLSGKESACNAGDLGNVGSIPRLGRSPGGGKWQPTQEFLPGESHGQRSLVGYSPWGHK